MPPVRTCTSRSCAGARRKTRLRCWASLPAGHRHELPVLDNPSGIFRHQKSGLLAAAALHDAFRNRGRRDRAIVGMVIAGNQVGMTAVQQAPGSALDALTIIS